LNKIGMKRGRGGIGWELKRKHLKVDSLKEAGGGKGF
jgi:hypothetical protein